MDVIDKIILSLYFPYYCDTNKSRFESFFKKLKTKNKYNTDYKDKSSYEIFPEKIIQGLDKRTTIILKNIPLEKEKEEIKNFVEQFGNINYLRILQVNNKKPNTSMAYINFINFKSIVNIYMYVRKAGFKLFNTLDEITILYSKIQGKQKLVEMFSKKN